MAADEGDATQTKRLAVVIGVTAVIAVAGVGAYVFGDATASSKTDRRPAAVQSATTPPRPVPPHEQECPGSDTLVQYRVSGSARGRALITYSTPSGIAQSERALPYEWEGCFGTYDYATISVQNPSDSGSVSCRIVIDGDVVASNTSSGAYVIASCDE